MPQIAITLAITAGSMAVNYLLTPRMKQQPVDKGKMDDIRLIGSDYGAHIPRLLSGTARLSGNIIFATPAEHYVVTTGGGGGGGKKGGGGGVTNEHIYKTSIGVLVLGNQIETFDRIWADTDLIVDNSPAATGLFEAEDATLSGGASSYVDATASSGDAVQNLGNGGKATFNVSIVATPPRPRGDPDEIVWPKTRISVYYKCSSDKIAHLKTDNGTGVVTDTLNLLNSNNIWTSITVIVEGFTDSVVYEYAPAATANIDYITVERFWQPEEETSLIPYRITGVRNPNIGYPPNLDDPSEFYNYAVDSVKADTTETYLIETSVPGMQVRVYTGTEEQLADSKVKSWLDTRYGAGEGVLRASAMRSQSWVMFQDFTLKGSSLPNFTFECKKGTETLNEALVILFNDVGLTASDYDLTATAGITQVGLLEHANQSRRSLIESYERYHFFRIVERDGKIRTVLDSFASIATLDADKLRAHDSSEEMPPHDAEVVIKEEHLLPRGVRVSFMNPDLEYHNDSVLAQLFASVSGTEIKDYSFPIIDPASEARNRSERLLLKEHNESKAIEVSGMPEYAKYTPGDVIDIPINGVARTVRIERKIRTLPIGAVKLQCLTVSPFSPTYIQDEVTSLANKAVNMFAQNTFPRNSVIFPIQSKPVRERDRGRLGLYLGICGRGRGVGERIALYRETGEDNYVLQDVIDTPALLGLCEDTLGTHGGGTSTEDTTNVLDIWFFDDITLESVTQDDLDRLPQVNLIRIGDEWIQFRTATVQTLEDNSPHRCKWRISNLWRGRFDTASSISTHGAGEYACLYSPALRFFDLESADIGETVNMKAVTANQALDIAPVCSFTFAGVQSAYTITNGTDDRTMDADSTSSDEIADLIHTMVKDLKI